jgi:hypothetical protein
LLFCSCSSIDRVQFKRSLPLALSSITISPRTRFSLYIVVSNVSWIGTALLNASTIVRRTSSRIAIGSPTTRKSYRWLVIFRWASSRTTDVDQIPVDRRGPFDVGQRHFQLLELQRVGRLVVQGVHLHLDVDDPPGRRELAGEEWQHRVAEERARR